MILRISLVALALLGSCTAPLTSAPPVAVTVVVDYGDAERPPLNKQTLVPAGASPIEALLDVAEVDQRYVNRTAGDVWGVEGVATNVEAGRFWTWLLNGRQARVAPDRYTLKNGDRVTWTYAASGKPDYR